MPTLRTFEFSVDTTFILEFGTGYIRFLKDFAYVMDGSVEYAVETPYGSADVEDLQVKQINDVVVITHPDYPPYKLSHLADNNWTMTEIVFNVPATLDENIDDTLTITPSGTTGTITLTATDGIFDADGHVGAYWRIGHLRDSDTVEQAISSNTTSASLEVLGEWTVRSYGTWHADIVIQRSRDGGTTWENVRRLKANDDRNVDVSGEEEEDNLLRLKIENYVSNTDGRAVLESTDAIIYGTVKITAVASSGGETATATVLEPLYSTAATFIWAEGAWSAFRGYPRAVTFHEGRIFYGGSTYQPLHIWGSVTNDFENFERGTADDSSVVFQLASTEFNAIQWMISQTDLLVGLAGAEWRVRGDRNGQIITPSRIDAKEQSKYGSEYMQPVRVGGQVLFVERRGRNLREMTYSYEVERYVSDTNLNLLSENILEVGVRQMAFQKKPLPTIWCVLNNGTCAALTYDRAQNVTGWHRHTTDGDFESVACAYGSPDTEDEVYFVVRRTINSQNVRYIERLDSTRWTEKVDAFFVDSGLTYNGSPSTTFSGLDHLAGETIDVLADGVVYLDLVVDSGGNFDLPSGADAASVVHAGLRFRTVISPFRFDADSALGVHSGNIKRIDRVVLRLYKSLGMEVEIEGTDVTVLPPEDHSGVGTDNPVLLGDDRPQDVEVDWTDGHTYDPTIVISQDQPLPLSVMSIAVGYEVSSG